MAGYPYPQPISPVSNADLAGFMSSLASAVVAVGTQDSSQTYHHHLKFALRAVSDEMKRRVENTSKP